MMAMQDSSPEGMASSSPVFAHSASASPMAVHEPQQMRQRTVQHKSEPEERDHSMRRFVRKLKTLDVYPKTEEDIAIKTGSGGLVSLASFALILFLTLWETWSFASPPTTHSIRVDTKPSQRLQINFDITFHALRCSETAIDVMDVSGEAQVAIEELVHRRRLTPDGQPIEATEYEDHAHDNEAAPPQLNPMLAALGLQPLLLNQGPDQHADKKGEGCRVTGTLLVNKVAGNMHIALGGQHGHGHAHDHEKEGGDHSAHGGAGPIPAGGHIAPGHNHAQPGLRPHPHPQQHVHQFMIHEMAQYNCSHTITHLSFGELYPGVVNPLDGVSQIIPAGAGSAHMQYFVKVVPTVYESSFLPAMSTNQFSVTRHSQAITMQDAFQNGGAQKIPGFFLVYEISPFMVRVSSKRVPLSTFLTSLFAIVGGVLTVAGILDALLFHSAKLTKILTPHAKK